MVSCILRENIRCGKVLIVILPLRPPGHLRNKTAIYKKTRNALTAIKDKYKWRQEEKAFKQGEYEHELFSTTDVSSDMFVWVQNISCPSNNYDLDISWFRIVHSVLRVDCLYKW